MARPGSRRALRRHHRARLIRARLIQVDDIAGCGSCLTRDPRVRGMLARMSYFRQCSCWICGNTPGRRARWPRGWWEGDAHEAIPRGISPHRVDGLEHP